MKQNYTAFLFAVLFHYIQSPVVDMKEFPATYADVVSEALYSEEVKPIEHSDKWTLIESSDGYKGWILSEHLHERKAPYTSHIEIFRVKAHIYREHSIMKGPKLSLPFGTKLKVIDDQDPRWTEVELIDGTTGFVQKGDVEHVKLLSKQEILSLSKKFLSLPYTWGGRSSFGFDCSGFCQMLYGKMGVHLPRDAKDQIQSSQLQPTTLEYLEPTDLIFFGPSQDKIDHVGMYLGNGEFIHSTVKENMPWLRISHLDDPSWNGTNKAIYPHRAFRKNK